MRPQLAYRAMAGSILDQAGLELYEFSPHQYIVPAIGEHGYLLGLCSFMIFNNERFLFVNFHSNSSSEEFQHQVVSAIDRFKTESSQWKNS